MNFDWVFSFHYCIFIPLLDAYYFLPVKSALGASWSLMAHYDLANEFGTDVLVFSIGFTQTNAQMITDKQNEIDKQTLI